MPLGGTRLELEIGQQVVSEHHELLPRTIGGVGLGRDALCLTVSGLSCVEEGLGSHLLSTTLEGLFQLQSVISRPKK